MKDHESRQRQRKQGRNLPLVCVRLPPGSGEDRQQGNRHKQHNERDHRDEWQPLTERRFERRHARHIRAGSAEETPRRREPRRARAIASRRSFRQRLALRFGQKGKCDETEQRTPRTSCSRRSAKARPCERTPSPIGLWPPARTPPQTGPRCSRNWFPSSAVEWGTAPGNRSRSRQRAKAGRSPSAGTMTQICQKSCRNQKTATVLKKAARKANSKRRLAADPLGQSAETEHAQRGTKIHGNRRVAAPSGEAAADDAAQLVADLGQFRRQARAGSGLFGQQRVEPLGPRLVPCCQGQVALLADRRDWSPAVAGRSGSGQT